MLLWRCLFFHEAFMGLSWRCTRFHGAFIVLSWGLHGCVCAFIGLTWGFRGGCINFHVGFSWDFHEAFVVLSWKCVLFHALSLAVHGESRAPVWCFQKGVRVHFHGTFMGFSRMEVCMRFQGALVDCHVASMVLFYRCFHGHSCGFRGAFMDFHGAFIGLPWGGVCASMGLSLRCAWYALPWSFLRGGASLFEKKMHDLPFCLRGASTAALSWRCMCNRMTRVVLSWRSVRLHGAFIEVNALSLGSRGVF